MTILIALVLFHLLGMFVGWLALLSGDLWQRLPYNKQVLRLLGWEWWLIVELVGDKKRDHEYRGDPR